MLTKPCTRLSKRSEWMSAAPSRPTGRCSVVFASFVAPQRLLRKPRSVADQTEANIQRKVGDSAARTVMAYGDLNPCPTIPACNERHLHPRGLADLIPDGVAMYVKGRRLDVRWTNAT